MIGLHYNKVVTYIYIQQFILKKWKIIKNNTYYSVLLYIVYRNKVMTPYLISMCKHTYYNENL
jgi:hypothetical protein